MPKKLSPLKSFAELFRPVEEKLPHGTFSPLARAIDAAPQNKATGEQWLNYLNNRQVDVGGQKFPLRTDELNATGIRNFLESAPRDVVSSADLLARQSDVAPMAYPAHEYLAFPNSSGDVARPDAWIGVPQFDEHVSPRVMGKKPTKYTEELTILPDLQYGSIHFVDPYEGGDMRGIVSHSRMSNRMLPAGKAVHIDEIQSDLHQFIRDSKRSGETLHESFDRIPYSKTYHEHEFNKALQRAAAENRPLVTWTTGRQQANRWDKEGPLVNNLRLTPEGLTFEDVESGYKPVITDPSKSLASMVGSELASRLSRGETIPETWLGGGGMRDFYDRTLSNYAKSVANRFPGSKVEDVSFSPNPEAGKPTFNYQLFMDKLRANDLYFSNAPPLTFPDMVFRYAMDPDSDASADILKKMIGFTHTPDEVNPKAIDRLLRESVAVTPAGAYDAVHGLHLSPEARTWIKKHGLPVMSTAPLAVMAAQGEQ